MSLNDLWDRTFWGLVIAVFVGLAWLKFLDPIIPCVWPGVVVSVAVGAAYITFAVRKLRQAHKP